MNTRYPFLVLILSFLLIAIPASAQRRGPGGGGGLAGGEISGIVVDGATGQPLASATVALWHAKDSTLATGTITERNGSFSIDGLRPGNYYLRITYVGYSPKIIGDVVLRPGSMQIKLEKVAMATDSALSNEVVVTAKREFMSVEIDRTVYNTDDLKVATGGNATDILRQIPSVDVDIDGNISLRGNQNVAILLNGRPMVLSGQALAAFLQGLPADAVEKIEVIPNPSAKYDPEGMSGILNIVLKQDKDRGLSGSVSGSAGTTGNYNLGTSLTYGSGPWNVFANYGFYYGTRESDGTSFQENRYREPITYLDQTSSNIGHSPSHSLNTSVDYAFDKVNSLSLSALLSTRTNDADALTSYRELDDTREPTRRYERGSNGTDDGFNQDYRLSYKWAPAPARNELSTELRYSADHGTDETYYRQQELTLAGLHENDTPDLQHTIEKDRNKSLSLRVDYVSPLWENARLEAGYNGELEQIGGDIYSESYDYGTGTYLADVAINNSYDYDRTIHAFYSTYGQEFGKFATQVGVRLEQALTTFDLKTTGESFDNNYFSVFPSAFLSYKPSDGWMLKASYSRRINRPRTRSLNPFTNFNDPWFRRIGNPYLQPEYTNAYEFSVTNFTEQSTLTVTPYFRRTEDIIRRYSSVDTNGITTLTFQNFDVSDSYGGDFSGTLRLGEWLNLLGSFSAYRIVTDASNVNVDLSNDAFGWDARGNATITFTPGLDMQVSYFYRAPIDVEGGRIAAFSRGDVALQQKILDDHGRIGVRVTDPFNARGFDIVRSDQYYYQEYHHAWNSRAVILTFSYNFGSTDRSSRRNRDRPSGDDSMDME